MVMEVLLSMVKVGQQMKTKIGAIVTALLGVMMIGSMDGDGLTGLDVIGLNYHITLSCWLSNTLNSKLGSETLPKKSAPLP